MSSTIKLDKDKKSKEVDVKTYRGMIGSLLYLTASGPDIMLVYAYVQDFNHVPRNLICLVLNKFFVI